MSMLAFFAEEYGNDLPTKKFREQISIKGEAVRQFRIWPRPQCPSPALYPLAGWVGSNANQRFCPMPEDSGCVVLNDCTYMN